MPLYDYQCSACGAVFETEHAMGSKPRVKCLNCGSTRTAKLFNAAGVQFKGSGFYVTDSRGKAEPSTPGEGSPKPASKDDATSPAKPAPAATTSPDPK